MNHLNMEVKIVPNKIAHEETFEIPIEAIREILVNAVCHRLLTENSRVQVAIYDDRVEITSPGNLANGLTLKEMLEGKTSIRNACIVNVFSYLNIIENWGTGVQRSIKLCEEAGVSIPEFIEMNTGIRVNFYRPSYVNDKVNDKVNAKVNAKVNLSENALKIHEIIISNPYVTRNEIANKIHKSESTVNRGIKELKGNGILDEKTSDKNGKWVIRRI